MFWGAEKGVSTMINSKFTALGGGNLIHDVGYIESGLTASYQQIVSMNEVAGLVKRFMGGIEFSDETIALEAIDRVGPGGNFVGDDHTFQHFRRNWAPELFNRSSREEWETNGILTLGDNATNKVRKIFEAYQAKPVNENVSEALDAIIQKAEKRAE